MKQAKDPFVLLFACTAFLGAGLLFLSELMVAKLLLPLFGGSPAVWNTCMVFFQAALLLGYVYAHFLVKKLRLTRQPLLHSALILLPLIVLPLALPAWAGSDAGDIPIWNILATLAVTIGAPFFILSTTGPLLQAWFASTTHPRAGRPYFLYAAGNLGSFVALLAYPFVVEPLLSLKQQTLWWAIGYGVFIVLAIGCAVALVRMRRRVPVAEQRTEPDASPITRRRKMIWLFLAALPSSLMLGVTTFITTDVAAIPLLWMAPLAIYLLTFVIAFSAKDPEGLIKKTAPVAGAMLLGSIVITAFPSSLPIGVVALFYFAMVGLITLVAHTRLAATKPRPTHLTEFYLWLAIGGVVGGCFNSLVAPVLLNDLYEFPLALLASIPVLVGYIKVRKPSRHEALLMLLPAMVAAVALVVANETGSGAGLVVVASLLGMALAAGYQLFRARPALVAVGLVPVLLVPLLLLVKQAGIYTERTFYGVIKIEQGDDARVLQHGFTQHGAQYTRGDRVQEPTTYYHKSGPLGDIFAACHELSPCSRIGGLGLGVGTVAAYGREGDSVTFYEIDPAIVRVANNPQYFTFLSGSRAKVDTVIGDGRLTLGKDSNTYNLLIIDAFSSDAIPMHLLTREAFALYKSKLTARGVLAIHISNRNLNLEPVLKAAVAETGMHAMVRYDSGNRGADPSYYPSKWAMMTTDEAGLLPLKAKQSWVELQGKNIRPWTDDYSNLLDAL